MPPRPVMLALLVASLALPVSAAEAAPKRAKLKVGDVSVGEGTGGARTAVLPVKLSRKLPATIKVSWKTVSGSAKAGADFTAKKGSVTIKRRRRKAKVRVPVLTDGADESSEAFKVKLTKVKVVRSKRRRRVRKPKLADRVGVVTIGDDDTAAPPRRRRVPTPPAGPAPPTFSIADAPAVSEGGTLTFTITLSRPLTYATTLTFRSAHGTADVGPWSGDYFGLSGAVSFPAGTTVQTVDVTTIDDDRVEFSETLLGDIEDPVAVGGGQTPTISDGQASGPITDNDAVPTCPEGDPPEPGNNAHTSGTPLMGDTRTRGIICGSSHSDSTDWYRFENVPNGESIGVCIIPDQKAPGGAAPGNLNAAIWTISGTNLGLIKSSGENPGTTEEYLSVINDTGAPQTYGLAIAYAGGPGPEVNGYTVQTGCSNN